MLDDERSLHEQMLDTVGRTQHERADGIGDRGIDLPERDVGELTGLERADLIAPAETASSVRRRERERRARAECLWPTRGSGEIERLAQLGDELAVLVRGGAIDAEPDGDPRGDERGDRRDASSEPRVGARAVCDTGARLGEALNLARNQVDAVREPDVRPEPAERLAVLDGATAEALEAEGLLVVRLGQVRVQAHAAATRELGGLAHQLARDRERRARRNRDPQHRAGRRVVVARDRLVRRRENLVARLADLVRRQAALRDAEVHRPAARMEAQPELPRCLDLGSQQVAAPAGEDVVVIGRRRAPRERELRQAGARRVRQDLGIEPRPDRV